MVISSMQAKPHCNLIFTQRTFFNSIETLGYTMQPTFPAHYSNNPLLGLIMVSH
jgi:hypothetical protein